MNKQLLQEWKKCDPLLSDLEGFQRFLDAHELKRLIRLIHPNQHGEPYTRFQVMRMIRERGVQLLEDLGWPSDLNSLYKNQHTGDVQTLKEIITQFTCEFDPLRGEMHKLEEKINELTQGEFYGDFAGVGLETCKVTQLKKLLKKHESQELEDVMRKAVLLHKGFYEQYFDKRLLTDEFFKNDTCVHNIVKQSRWLGFPLEELVPEESLPPKSYDSGVFIVLEHWEPKEVRT